MDYTSTQLANLERLLNRSLNERRSLNQKTLQIIGKLNCSVTCDDDMKSRAVQLLEEAFLQDERLWILAQQQLRRFLDARHAWLHEVILEHITGDTAEKAGLIQMRSIASALQNSSVKSAAQVDAAYVQDMCCCPDAAQQQVAVLHGLVVQIKRLTGELKPAATQVEQQAANKVDRTTDPAEVA